jgi:hypothetical protein
MNLLDHDAEGVTIHFDGMELLMIMALIQEGRISFQCDGPTGQALDDLFCSAVILVEEARKTGQKIVQTH